MTYSSRQQMTGRQIRIGTSGWNYPSGAGAWNGIFYPPKGRRHRPPGFDELAFYAEHFDTVEVNSTFYGVPKPPVAAAWASRTPEDFVFSLKLHQQFTHPKMFAAATRERGHDGRPERRRSVPGGESTRCTGPASSARCSRSFPRASGTTVRPMTTWPG